MPVLWAEMLGDIENPDLPPDSIAALRRSVGWGGMDAELKDPAMKDYLRIACFDGDELVGFLAVVSNGVTDAYIQDVMVRPDYQGRGIGTELMERAIERLKRSRIYMISVIYGEEELRPFYEKFGFYTMLCGQMETRPESGETGERGVSGVSTERNIQR